jgi:hypothetical protein
MDDEDSDVGQDKTWSEKEEMRRAWWLVWELDTFGSSVSSRPFMIDPTRMSVSLPVSDEIWLSDIETTSAKLIADPGSSWKSIHNVENQTPRAWFLVTNFLMSLAHVLSQRKAGISLDTRIRLEYDISCVKLALPPSMSLDAEFPISDPVGRLDRNWTIGTHLMIISASWLMHTVSTKTEAHVSIPEPKNASSLPGSFPYDKARVLAQWRSEEVAVAHPFYTLMLINPFPESNNDHSGDLFALPSCRNLSRLLLRQFSFRWKIGLIASSKEDHIHHFCDVG